jgi:hypothetical protein
MRRILMISFAAFALAGCNKEQTAANCRLDVARQWSVDVLKECIEPWSPFASRSIQPKYSETDQAKSFMQLCMKTAGYSLESRCESIGSNNLTGNATKVRASKSWWTMSSIAFTLRQRAQSLRWLRLEQATRAPRMGELFCVA